MIVQSAKIKSLIKDLIPPIAFSFINRERTYRSFQDAEQHSPMHYDAELLGRFRVERAMLNMHSLSSNLLPPAYSFLLLAVQLSQSGNPHIVDFGGACGEWGYVLTRDSTKPFNYTIVENADLARRCSTEPFFRWASWTSAPPEGTFDIFTSSGTFSYIEDPYGILKFALVNAKEYIVLGRNSFCETDIFRVHKSLLISNGFGEIIPYGYRGNEIVHYPHRTLSLQKVLRLAADAGWRVKLQADSQSGVVPFRGMVFGRDLLLSRT